MKKIIVVSFIFLFACVLSGCDFTFNKNNSNQPITAKLNESKSNVSNRNNTMDKSNNTGNEISNDDNNNSNNNDDEQNKNFNEIEIANFSTPLTSGSPNRIVNIKLTCNKINEMVLKNGETFSFNKIVGPCTAEEGYLKAEIFVNKKIQYALGGGNCQVSTTLYNSCLQVDGITITERHEHGRDVDYIEDGKDATVSYNTLDFAFQNNTGYDLKLFASCDDKNVYSRICKLEEAE